MAADPARDAAVDAGLVSPDLLGDFLPVVTAAVASATPLTRRSLRPYRELGATAAQRGVALRALLDLYLSAAWRLWPHLPAVAGARADPDAVVAAGHVMLRAVDDVVAELTEGYQLARRAVVRAQASARREFVDDLLTGGSDVAGLSTRAATFGLELSGPHAVLVIRADRPFLDSSPVTASIDRAVAGTKGDADALVATKEDRLVVVFSAPDQAAVAEVLTATRAALGPRPSEATDGDGPVDLRRPDARLEWQLGVGRPYTGASGVVESYQEAREALDLAAKLGLVSEVVDARDLLVHHVLLRDRAAMSDLVSTLLGPLDDARGGAGPLVDTLEQYFASGGNTARTARAMHLSVRAVTYRLERVHQLTGYHVDDPGQRFALNTAVLGARLLGWPARPHE